jgi:hypothetical protein
VGLAFRVCRIPAEPHARPTLRTSGGWPRSLDRPGYVNASIELPGPSRLRAPSWVAVLLCKVALSVRFALRALRRPLRIRRCSLIFKGAVVGLSDEIRSHEVGQTSWSEKKVIAPSTSTRTEGGLGGTVDGLIAPGVTISSIRQRAFPLGTTHSGQPTRGLPTQPVG